jgi:putative ABC transport system ATP-binding protein
MITQPAMILGDEPTGNLDPANRDHVAEMLFTYSEKSAASLMVVTHDYELVTQFDRTIDIQEYAA